MRAHIRRHQRLEPEPFIGGSAVDTAPAQPMAAPRAAAAASAWTLAFSASFGLRKWVLGFAGLRLLCFFVGVLGACMCVCI